MLVFKGKRKKREPEKRTFRARARTYTTKFTSKPGPLWWEASTLTTALSLVPNKSPIICCVIIALVC